MDFNLRNEILECSKKLFFQNGYNKTSIRQIANALNIHHPNIYYYFKSKKDIAFTLYGNIYQELDKKISECIPSRDVYYTATYLRLHYKVFYWNKELFTLFYDFSKEGIVEEYVRPYAVKNYHLYLDAFNLDISEKDLNTYFSIATAIGFRFVDELIHKKSTINLEDAINLMIRAPLLYMEVDKESIDDVVKQSFINANKVHTSYIQQIVNSFISDIN